MPNNEKHDRYWHRLPAALVVLRNVVDATVPGDERETRAHFANTLQTIHAAFELSLRHAIRRHS